MLVKLTNTGAGDRVVYGIGNVMRTVLPGKSTEANLWTRQVERFEKAHEAGDTLAVDRLGHDIEKARAEEIVEEEMAREPEPEPEKIERPPAGFTWGDNVMQEPRSRAEIGRPDKLPDVEPIEQVPLPAMADRITQQALHRQPEPPPQPPQPDPTTIHELLNRINTLPEADVRRLATSFLPPNTLPGRPRKAAIVDALLAHANQGAADGTRK